MAAPIKLYNTLSRKIEDFVPIEAGKIGLYVCGMTVYDHCHVGHARAMIVFDSLVRYLRYRGWDVNFVRNITDVDDKIIARANAAGEDSLAYAQRYIDSFHADMQLLGNIAPDVEPRVSTSIDAIVALIQNIVEHGNGYVAEGNVWFSVPSFSEYGKLSNQKVEELRSADEVAGKRSPADFALWKAAKPGEPSWPSPWGPGRPGWHIECSAMCKTSLGDTFDIHGGGLDLVFPHHENEVAQSECGNHKPFANYWLHNGLLTMTGGQKMGKSLGNVINVTEAIAAFPAECLRLYYLQNQYRSPLPWSDEALPEALGMLSRLYDAREKAEEMQGSEDAERVAKDLGKDAAEVLRQGCAFSEKFLAAADHDFNTAEALGHLFALARSVNRFSNHKKAKKRGAPVVAAALAAFKQVHAALGLMGMSSEAFHEEVKEKRLSALGLQRADVERKVAERSAARVAKDWSLADQLRDELNAMNIEILDGPTGVSWRVRLLAREDSDN